MENFPVRHPLSPNIHNSISERLKWPSRILDPDRHADRHIWNVVQLVVHKADEAARYYECMNVLAAQLRKFGEQSPASMSVHAASLKSVFISLP